MVVVALGIAAVAHLSRSNLLSCLLPNPDRTGNGVPLIIALQLYIIPHNSSSLYRTQWFVISTRSVQCLDVFVPQAPSKKAGKKGTATPKKAGPTKVAKVNSPSLSQSLVN